jgi:CBS domain-containing protein
MKVSDMLQTKGSVLYTASPTDDLLASLKVMAERDVGSLVVMEHGALVGMVTVRELTQVLVHKGGNVQNTTVAEAMQTKPVTCTADSDIDEVRRLMLDHHARYLPVMDQSVLMGVISFHDVARAVVDSQHFENKMLKSYIRDWPEPQDDAAAKL